MNRIIKWLLFMFLLSALCSRSGRAQTINAATCSTSDVQTALNSVKADGTTVVIPAGTCTWTTRVTYSQSFSTTIQGQSTTTGTCGPGGTCTARDSTIITDNLTRPVGCGTGDGAVFALNTAANKSLRLTGVTMRYTSNATCVGSITISGSSHQIRIDHNHLNGVSYVAVGTYGFTWGVIDHNLFDLPNGTWNAIKFQEDHWNNDTFNAGDASWADATTFGSNRAIYVENNFFIVTGAGSAGYSNDCTQGGRYVWRFNVMTNSGIQTHPTGGGQRHRGCRMEEVYGNTFTGTGGIGAVYNAFWLSSGSVLVWNNTTNNGYNHFVSVHSMRRNNNTYSQNPTPSGWGYCGTSFNGTGSAWDQNANVSTGRRCIDRPGAGVGDLLTNDFPNVTNVTANCGASVPCWLHQHLEPVYEWLNVAPVATFWGVVDGELIANEDYYNYTGTFNGSSGVGSGTLAARPSTCTANPDAGGIGGVAYWATDQGNWNQSGSGGQGVLYTCTATNTWTAYYTPYTYPHPLTLGSGTPPAPPMGLAAVVN